MPSGELLMKTNGKEIKNSCTKASPGTNGDDLENDSEATQTAALAARVTIQNDERQFER
jgi:hypothetical protein